MWKRYLKVFNTLYVVGRYGQPTRIEEKRNVEVSSAPHVHFILTPNISSPQGILYGTKKALELLEPCLKKVDAVVARLPSQIGLLVIHQAIKRNIPFAIEVVGCVWDGLWNYGTMLGKLSAPLMVHITRQAVAKAPYVLYVTSNFLQQRYPNNKGVKVSCSNVEIPQPQMTVLRSRIRKIHDKSKRSFSIGLIGTLKTRYKGIDTVFDALQQIQESFPFVTFHVLGVGDQKPWKAEAARKNIAKRVFFDGTLKSGKDVFNWLDEKDLYLQPSLTEGLPRSLIEAMSRGCPAIASLCADIPSLLPKGCLIKPNDSKRLAQLIRHSITHPDWLHKQAVINWNKAAEYSNSILDRKRTTFWRSFAEYVKSLR